MSFWDEYPGYAAPKGPYRKEGSDARIAKGASAGAARTSSQNAATECGYCGHLGDDVLLGVCADCLGEP